MDVGRRVRYHVDDLKDVRLGERATLSKQNDNENHITHRALDSQILPTVDGRSDSNEIPAPRFCTQRLQRHTLKRIDVFIGGEFISINRSDPLFTRTDHDPPVHGDPTVRRNQLQRRTVTLRE